MVQFVTTKDAIWPLTCSSALTSEMAAPVAMEPASASARLTCDRAQNTAQQMPSIEPWEKSRQPIVMMSQMPQAPIMSM